MKESQNKDWYHSWFKVDEGITQLSSVLFLINLGPRDQKSIKQYKGEIF
jgi:hypothetical protein